MQFANRENRFQQQRLFRRRLQDVRIWKQICAAGYEWAAIRLCRGYGYLVQGGKLRTSSWAEKVCQSYHLDNGGLSDTGVEYLSRCKTDYICWADACVAAGLNHRAAMDILFSGCGADEVERIYHHRHGWAIKNLLQALELYRK